MNGVAASKCQRFVVGGAIVVSLPKEAVHCINRGLHHNFHLVVGDMGGVGNRYAAWGDLSP